VTKFHHCSNCMITITLIVLTLLILLFKGVSADEYQPRYKPSIQVSRMVGSIVIDGDLNDSGWKNVPVADNFAEHYPGDQTRPPVETKAMMTYDDENLYVAFVCYDEPGKVRASYADRDDIGRDDNICLLIDTYGDAAWAYELNVNPYGIQGDYLWSKYGGEDEAMNLIWDAMGKVTDSGYQIEMAVPFSSLSFPDTKEQIWKVDFWRNHPRESRRQYSWAAYDRDEPCWPCQWGTVSGISDVHPGKGVELLPSLIGFQSGSLVDSDDPNSGWNNENIDGEASVGIKYAISSDMVAEATYNPDFSQIESDEAQVDVNTTFALFFPERRPFFQEGSELFNTWLNAVYTRSINDPSVAAKVVGRQRRFSVAYLVAQDEHSPIMIPMREQTAFGLGGKSTSNILRVRQTFGEENHFGALFTDRRFNGEGSGTVFGYDIALKFWENYSFRYQLLGSYTEELNEPDLIDTTKASGCGQVYFDHGRYTVALDGEKYSGHDMFASLSRSGRHFWFEMNYNEEAPTFRADNGFVFMNGTRSTEINTGYLLQYDDKFIDNFESRMGYGRVWVHRTGHFKDEWFWVEAEAMLKGQTNVEIGALTSREDFHDIRFNGISNVFVDISSSFSEILSVSSHVSYGHRIARTEDPPVMGKETNVIISMSIKPSSHIRIQPSFQYFKNVEKTTDDLLNEGYIFRSRFNYQFNKEFQARMIVQYDDFDKVCNLEPLLTYRLSSFSVFYLGSTYAYQNFENVDWKKTDRQFFLKMQYLIQI